MYIAAAAAAAAAAGNFSISYLKEFSENILCFVCLREYLSSTCKENKNVFKISN